MREIALFSKYNDWSHAALRISFGVLFAFHGAQKLFGAFGGQQASSTLMWVAGVVELFGGLAVALGLFTQMAAFLCAGQMLVGYFMVHFPQGWIPIQNRGEMALLYFFGFVYLMTHGGRCCSLDRKMAR